MCARRASEEILIGESASSFAYQALRQAVAPFDEVWVDDFYRAAVYISGPGGGLPISSMAASVGADVQQRQKEQRIVDELSGHVNYRPGDGQRQAGQALELDFLAVLRS